MNKKVKIVVNQEKADETVNLINKVFSLSTAPTDEYVEGAKEALQSFFDNYLNCGLAGGEQWTLVFGKKKYCRDIVCADSKTQELYVNFEDSLVEHQDMRNLEFPAFLMSMIKEFYRAVLSRYAKLYSDQKEGNKVSEETMLAYENLIGQDMARHCAECMQGGWIYENAAWLMEVFQYARPSEAEKYAPIRKIFEMMAERDDKVVNAGDEKGYQSWALFPEGVHAQVMTYTLSQKLLFDMIGFVKKLEGSEIDADKMIYITPTGIKEVSKCVKSQKRKLEGGNIDLSQTSFKMGRLFMELQKEFNEELYLDYLINLKKAGESLTPSNTERLVKIIYSSRGHLSGGEEFMERVIELAEQRSEKETDSEMLGFYDIIITVHKLATGEIDPSEFDDEDDYDEDDYDDVNEDDGNRI